MGIQTDVMRMALEKYLGTEKQWCKGSYAKKFDGSPTFPGRGDAVSHCAEGAIEASAIHQLPEFQRKYGPLTWRVSTETLIDPILVGLVKVLNDQHPEFVEANDGNLVAELPFFNDGMTLHDGSWDKIKVKIASVGYQGIKDAFEKYLVLCEEKDL